MDDKALYIPMSVAGKIFTHLSESLQQAESSALLGNLHNIHGTLAFSVHEQTTSNTTSIPVYASMPNPQALASHSRFLVVVTDTKGVLELKGYTRSASCNTPFQVIAH